MFVFPSGHPDLNVARKDDQLDKAIKMARVVDVCIDDEDFNDPQSTTFYKYIEAIVLGSCCDPGELLTFRRQVLLCRNKDVYRHITGGCQEETRNLLERFEYQTFRRLPDRKNHDLFLMLLDENQAKVDNSVLSWVRYMASDNTGSQLVIAHPECPLKTRSIMRGLEGLFADCDDYVTVVSRSDQCHDMAQVFAVRSRLINGSVKASSHPKR